MQLINDDFDWESYAEAPERSKVIAAATLAEQVIASFYDNSLRGDFLPWEKTQDRIRYRRREVTVYSGINGHGKSLVISQVALGLMRQSERVLICSFEMRPSETMKRMTRQAAVTPEPAVPYIRAFHKWTDDRLWLYDHFGNCEARKVLAVCRYAARELNIKHVFVDSLMKCVAATDDYTGQKLFVGDLCGLALAYDIHVHLVTHAKKGERERDEIDKFSIRGAGEIADQVDNVILIQRNKKKEARAENGQEDGDYDQFLTISKQRNGDYEGVLGLFFDRRSLSYVERHGASARPLEIETRQPGEDG